MIPASFTPGVHHSPLALLCCIKSKGQRILAETTSYFALTVVLSSFIRLLQVPIVYERALIPLVTKYQMYIQSFHFLIGFHTRGDHKDSDGVRAALSDKAPPSAMPHNFSLMLHTLLLIVAVTNWDRADYIFRPWTWGEVQTVNSACTSVYKVGQYIPAGDFGLAAVFPSNLYSLCQHVVALRVFHPSDLGYYTRG